MFFNTKNQNGETFFQLPQILHTLGSDPSYKAAVKVSSARKYIKLKLFFALDLQIPLKSVCWFLFPLLGSCILM